MELPPKYRLTEGPLEVVDLTQQPNDRLYWLSKSPAERFEALELLRQMVYGYDPDTARLQRILEVFELDWVEQAVFSVHRPISAAPRLRASAPPREEDG